MRLSRRSSWNAEGANCFEIKPEVFSGRKSRNGKRCLRCGLDRRLRNRGVSHLTGLAMQLIVRVRMPVADCVRGIRAHRKDECDCHQADGYSFCHARHFRTSIVIISLPLPGRQESCFLLPSSRNPHWITPAIHRLRGQRRGTEQGPQGWRGKAARSIPLRSRSQMVSACRSRCRWKARRAASRGRRRARSS